MLPQPTSITYKCVHLHHCMEYSIYCSSDIWEHHPSTVPYHYHDPTKRQEILYSCKQIGWMCQLHAYFLAGLACLSVVFPNCYNRQKANTVLFRNIIYIYIYHTSLQNRMECSILFSKLITPSLNTSISNTGMFRFQVHIAKYFQNYF